MFKLKQVVYLPQKENVMTAQKITPLINTTPPVTKSRIISLYMEYVLEQEKIPVTVYRFCKDVNITEEQFYEFFGSFKGLQKDIWNLFYDNTIKLIDESPEFEALTNREKLLTFFFTFFELLTANRSYILFSLSGNENMMKNLEQLKGLRRRIKSFATGLIREANEEKQLKVLKQSETVFSEAAWVQFLFLLKFWIDDNSPKFESTDVAIEKSVNTVFDLFDNTPLERVLDFGKFLWKEKMA